jgi:hypothetical protein
VKVAFTDPRKYQADDWAGDVSPHIHRWSPQVDWISVNGRLAVDFVARLENINQDFQEIRAQIGLQPVNFPHANAKWHKHYSQYYDPATRDLVGQYYARDIEAFGYQFEECSTFSHVREQSRSRFFAGLTKRFKKRSSKPEKAGAGERSFESTV